MCLMIIIEVGILLIWMGGLIFTTQPSGLEGYCRHGPGGRPPNLRNPYLCNRLMDFLRSKFCGIV